MTPSVRKLALTAHVTSSVGWAGAILAYLAPAIAGLVSEDPELVRASYLTMELIIRFVIVPCSIAALLTGLVQSLGTDWGLLRHYWIVAKLALAVPATVVLVVHVRTVEFMRGAAVAGALSSSDLRPLRLQLLVHAVGGLGVLLAATALSFYKPWGRTPYGQRVKQGRSLSAVAARPPSAVPLRRYLLIGLAVLFLLALLGHLVAGSGGLRH